MFKGQNNYYIVAGYGTKALHLGLTREDLIGVLGKPNEEYKYDHENCTISEMHWAREVYSDGSHGQGDGVFAYLRENSVFQISSSEYKK